jgi:hypothetical protein
MPGIDTRCLCLIEKSNRWRVANRGLNTEARNQRSATWVFRLASGADSRPLR